MSQKQQISIALLGEDSDGKRSLERLILGKDKTAQQGIEILQNDFKIINAKSKSDIQADMSLEVIRDDSSKQINQLEITNQEKEFLVVLPLSSLERLILKLRGEATTTSGQMPSSKTRMTGHRDIINIVLLGQTGTGKSACGNTIMGKPDFPSEMNPVPLTRECQKGEVTIQGKKCIVIDTPDFFYKEVDMQTPKENKEIKKCRDLCQSGPCVYLLVMQLGRFTDGERNLLEKLEKAFGDIREKTIVLFTHGDSLKRENTSLSAFVKRTDGLKAIVEQCGGRCHVFDNISSPENNQVTDLMQKVYALIYGHSQDKEGDTSADKQSCVVC